MSEELEKRGPGRPPKEVKTTTRINLQDNELIPPSGQFFGFINADRIESYLLMPGVDADVPNHVVDILDNAKQALPIFDQNRKVIGYRPGLRFNYQTVRERA